MISQPTYAGSMSHLPAFSLIKNHSLVVNGLGAPYGESSRKMVGDFMHEKKKLLCKVCRRWKSEGSFFKTKYSKQRKRYSVCTKCISKGENIPDGYSLRPHKILNDEKMYPKMVRDCLKCGMKFTAKGRFMRVCQNCKETEEYRQATRVRQFKWRNRP